MLLRLVDHFKDNPKRIDKLICIKGLPDDWFFKNGEHGKELKRPWEPDVDKNIPYDVQQACCEKVQVVVRHPAIHREAKEIIESRPILGVRLDYNSEPGRELWDRIERYVEESIPRDERIPVPVLCARDERSPFETHMPRRTSRGALELIPSPVPIVDLTRYQQVKVVAQVVRAQPVLEEAPVAVEAKKEDFKCEQCDYTHRSKQGIRMHATKRHPKEKVGA